MGQDKPPQPNAPGTQFRVIDKPSASVQPPLVPSATPLMPTIDLHPVDPAAVDQLMPSEITQMLVGSDLGQLRDALQVSTTN